MRMKSTMRRWLPWIGPELVLIQRTLAAKDESSYLQKKIDEALDDLNKAVALDPSMPIYCCCGLR